MIIVVVIVAAAALAILASSVRVLKQYERAVIFHLGKVSGGARGPGLIFFVPLINRVDRVSLRIITMPIQSQGIITATTSASTCPRSPTTASRIRSAP